MEVNMELWSINQELVDLIVSRSGGITTSRILDQILIKPQNAHQLSKILNLNYKTITYHTNIMQEHDFVYKKEFDKIYYFHPTEKIITHINEYTSLKKQLGLL